MGSLNYYSILLLAMIITPFMLGNLIAAGTLGKDYKEYSNNTNLWCAILSLFCIVILQQYILFDILIKHKKQPEEVEL
jgi:hypothetical protein